MKKEFKTVDNIDVDGVISTKTTFQTITMMEAEPNYIKLYIDDIGRMKGLQPAHAEILVYIAALVDCDGYVTLNSRRKASIALTVGGSSKTVDNAITAYIKAGLLLRVGRAEYELSPNLFARGEWRKIRERRMAFIVNVRYSFEKGREIHDLEIEVTK